MLRSTAVFPRGTVAVQMGAPENVALLKAHPESDLEVIVAVASVRDVSPDPAKLASDIMTAGDGVANPAAIDQLVHEGPEAVRELLIDELGVGFDRQPDGALHLTREGGHSLRRIIHTKDTTGHSILAAVAAKVTRPAASRAAPVGPRSTCSRSHTTPMIPAIDSSRSPASGATRSTRPAAKSPRSWLGRPSSPPAA